MLPYEKAIKERKVLVKQESETNPKFGCKPEDRSIKDLLNLGIININKPKGPTSHEVAEFTKNILGIPKAGQSGTLDPGVTGVLPIGLGRATRALITLLKAGKEYVCLMHLHEEIPEKELRKVINDNFIGIIKQMPPLKSAVVRKLRDRKIYYIDIIEIKGKEVLFRVGCQAGTYVRKLCDDIGKKLGCGAHMAQLVRTKVGMFNDDNLHTLQELSDAFEDYNEGNEKPLKKIIQPIETAVEHIPKVWIADSAVDSVCNGSYLTIPGICKFDSDVADSIVAVLTLKGELVGLGTALMSAKKIMSESNGPAVKMDSVIMEIGVYPKWKK